MIMARTNMKTGGNGRGPTLSGTDNIENIGIK